MSNGRFQDGNDLDKLKMTSHNGQNKERVARFKGSDELINHVGVWVGKTKVKKTSKKWPCVKEYLLDSLILTAMFATTLTVYLIIEPRHVGYICNDITLTLPYKEDTISTGTLLSVCIVIPMVTIFFTELFKRGRMLPVKQIRDRIRCFAKYFGTCMFGFLAEVLLVEISKSGLGKHRPHFFAVCQPDAQTQNCSNRYISQYHCDNKDAYDASTVRDAFRSLPSGHAAASMYSVVFTVLYIQKSVCLSFSHLLKPVIQTVLMCLALFVSVTRITDNKHHVVDIFVGWLYGVIAALFTFYMVTIPMAVSISAHPTINKTNSLLTTYSVCSQDSEPVTPQTPAPLVFQPDLPTRNIIAID